MNIDEKIKCDCCSRIIPKWQQKLEMDNDSQACYCSLIRDAIKLGRKLERKKYILVNKK